jgi:hypothetical protein
MHIIIWITSLLTLTLTPAFAEVTLDEDDLRARGNYRQECLEVAQYSIDKLMDVECHYNYHHYNASAYKKLYKKRNALKGGSVKIAEFNVLHPGMSKTRYKDYKKVAQMINNWDVVGVTELLPLLSDDLANNRAVVRFIERTPELIEKHKNQLEKEESLLAGTTNARSITTIQNRIEQLKVQIESLEQDLKRAPTLYRDPGYVQILKELRKLPDGHEWSLLLSPRGEAAKETDVQELVGYYYRASKVRPQVNEYCKQIKTINLGSPFACLPNMSEEMLGMNKRDIFSRRPFIAEFISGNFSFILLTSHVVYNSPRDPETMANILTKAFGATHPSELGVGINLDNYARFAEVRVMLEFMQALRTRFKQKDVILLGDLNLEARNPFWNRVLSAMPGVQIFVEEKTTLSDLRFSRDNTETFGLANDYDHFLFDPKETNECVNKDGSVDAKAENFMAGDIGASLREKYIIRADENELDDYTRNDEKVALLEAEFILPYQNLEILDETIGTKSLSVSGKTLRIPGIITDGNKTAKYIEGFYERVIESQLKNSTYYFVYKQLISDHLPIVLTCRNK